MQTLHIADLDVGHQMKRRGLLGLVIAAEEGQLALPVPEQNHPAV